MSANVLEMRHISKQFPGVKALDDVGLDVRPGEVHGLVGENGAGKSTLMNILTGMYAPDAGEIVFKGKPVRLHSIRDSLNLGISMIHQELLSVPALSVADNIFLGKEDTRAFPTWINQKLLIRKSQALLDEMGVNIAASARMSTLSVAQQQMVEIAKAISNRSDVIVMDEPTSAITEHEVGVLFRIIRSLTEQGIAVIYISHKLNEIFAIADRVTVLRDGCHIATREVGEVNEDSLISMMVGREVKDLYPKPEAEITEEILRVEGLAGPKYRDVDFSLRRGEILGFAGLMGSGRTEIVRGIYGLDPKIAGTVYIDGKRVEIGSPADAIRAGIGLVSEDRRDYGLVLGMSVRENVTLAALRKCCRAGMISSRIEKSVTDSTIKSFRIKTPSQAQQAVKLSGGNQQKVVLGKVLLNDPDIIILDEPTRGIDVGAKAEIYQMITKLAAMGKGVVMISSEMPEVLGLSDRVLVVHEGRIKGELSRAEATQESVMQIALSSAATSGGGAKEGIEKP